VLLYILVFANEPLIKIGITRDLVQRLRGLQGEFNLAESFFVTASDPSCVRLVEKNLHAIFAEYRAYAQSPLASGNTEIFKAAHLPKILHTIEAFKSFFAYAEIRLKKGSPVIAEEKPKLPRPLSRREQLLADLKAWSEKHQIKQAELARMLGVHRSAVTDWYKRRKTPTAEQALTMLELLRTGSKQKDG
jgi:DNA-binding transcriptional regulator YiaG